MLKFILMILALILVVFLWFTLTYWKWIISSEYGVVVLYGVMGSGKSTLLQRWIAEYASKGWKIFTNYDFSFGSRIDPKIIGHVEFPENSLIVVDEAGTVYNNRNWKDTDKDFLIYLKDIRKHKNRIIFVSQNADLDVKIRNSAHRIYVLSKWWLFSIAKGVSSTIDITNGGKEDSASGGDIIFKYEYMPFFTWIVSYLPRWSNYFDSFVKIQELPLFEPESYDSDYEKFSKDNYKKYRNKFIKNRWKEIFCHIRLLFKNFINGIKVKLHSVLANTRNIKNCKGVK